MSKLKAAYFVNPVRFLAATLVRSGPRSDLNADELCGALVTDRFLEILMLNGDYLCVPLHNVSALVYDSVAEPAVELEVTPEPEKKVAKRGRPVKA